MKTIILLAIICFSKIIYGQNCKDFYYLQNNKIVEMTIYNKKGNETGKRVYLISNVKNEGSVMSSTITLQMFDRNEKSLTTASNKIECNGGILKMDMKMFILSQQMEQMKNSKITATGTYIEYAPTMKVGDKLADGKMNTTFTNNGITNSMDMIITDRYVEGKETVTSPAGSWEAFKITYNSNTKMKVAGIGIPVNTVVTEWYVPDFGIVKTESKYGSTLITAIR